MGGSLYFHLNKIINLYVVHLIAARRYELVPRYARHMRHTLLVETYARFLELLAPVGLALPGVRLVTCTMPAVIN